MVVIDDVLRALEPVVRADEVLLDIIDEVTELMEGVNVEDLGTAFVVLRLAGFAASSSPCR